MATNDEIVAHIGRLGVVVRSAHLKRSLTEINPTPSLNFWRLIYGNLLDVAVLEWCKVFGSDAEPTHWKRVVSDHERFRTGLLSALGIDQGRWVEYWNHMKTYRDTQVAHHWNAPPLTHYPDLTLALESSYFYYDYLICELRRLGDRRFPDDVRDYCTRFAAQATEIARQALSATAGFSEQVS